MARKPRAALVKPAGNQILHGTLMQIPNHEGGGIDIAPAAQQLMEFQRLQPSGNRHSVKVAPLELTAGAVPHLTGRQYAGPVCLVQHLQPAGQIHRVPDHRVRQAPRGTDVADQNLSRSQTDACGKRRRTVHSVIEPVKGSLYGKRCFACPRGMIRDAMRCIEEGEHAVADELVDKSATILDSLLQHIEIVAQIAHQFSGGHVLGDPGKTSYVRDQDGQDTQLTTRFGRLSACQDTPDNIDWNIDREGSQGRLHANQRARHGIDLANGGSDRYRAGKSQLADLRQILVDQANGPGDGMGDRRRCDDSDRQEDEGEDETALLVKGTESGAFSVAARVIATSSMKKKAHPNGSIRFCVSLPELSILEEGARNNSLWYRCTLEQNLPRLAGTSSGCI